MDNDMDLLSLGNLPLDLGDLGTVTEAALAMPGVYDAILECSETGLAVEAFIVLSNAGDISAKAKRYGKAVPDHPGLLLYLEDETGNTIATFKNDVSRKKQQTNADSPEEKHKQEPHELR